MGWAELQERYPWPEVRPAVAPHVHGWTVHERAWRELLAPLDCPVVLEVGAWTGKTSLWLLREFPALRLVAVDFWTLAGYWAELWNQWLAERVVGPDDTPLDLYRANLWAHRDRCVAVRGRSIEGMNAVSDLCSPDVVYIDADHDYGHACGDIIFATSVWPDAIVCGDDFEDREPPVNGVKEAVLEVAEESGYEVRRDGRFWRYE